MRTGKLFHMTLIGMILFFFNYQTVCAQQITVSPEISIKGDRLVEKSEAGYLIDHIYTLGNPGEPGYKYYPYIYLVGTNNQVVSTFDYKTDCSFSSQYIDHIYLTSRIIVFIRRKADKAKNNELVAVEVDKKTLKKTGEKLIPVPVNCLEEMYLVKATTNGENYAIDFLGMDMTKEGMKKNNGEPVVFTKRMVLDADSKVLASDEGEMITPSDITEAKTKSSDGGGYQGAGTAPAFGVGKNGFVFMANLFRLNQKAELDIAASAIFRRITPDGQVIKGAIDVEKMQLAKLTCFYNKSSDEIVVVGLKKGSTTKQCSGYHLIFVNPVDFKIVREKYTPFDSKMIDNANRYLNLKKGAPDQIPTEFDFVDMKMQKDGSIYLVWQFSIDASYSEKTYTESPDFLRPTNPGNVGTGYETKRTSKTVYVSRTKLGPIVIASLDPALNQKWMNFVPRGVANFALDPFAWIDAHLVNDNLYVFYNDAPENLAGGMEVTEPKKTFTVIVNTVPAVTIATPDGKLTRKQVLSAEQSNKRMFVTLGCPETSGSEIDFLLQSSRGGAKPQLVNLKY